MEVIFNEKMPNSISGLGYVIDRLLQWPGA